MERLESFDDNDNLKRDFFFFFFFSFFFFLFFRDGYKVVDVCGMKNRGVSFMKVSEYHSGMQQGGIRVLEGHWGVGWATFEGKLKHFFFGEGGKSHYFGVVIAEDGRETADTMCNGWSSQFGQSLKSGISVKSSKPISHLDKVNAINQCGFRQFERPCALLVLDAPRLTCQFKFVWKSFLKT